MVDQSSQSGSFYSETNGIGLEKRELFISENEAITKPPKNSNDFNSINFLEIRNRQSVVFLDS